MKRKSTQINPESPLEAASEETTFAVEAESSPTIEQTTAASVKAESTESSAMEMVAPPVVETVGPEADEATSAPSTPEPFPAVGKYLSKAVYGTFYCASYGVVFTALLIARTVPMNNLMGRAIKDGALAAENALKALEQPAVSERTPNDSPVMSA